MIEIRLYEDENGRCEFDRWFNKVNAPAAARITKALTRMENGNFGTVKSVGKGVSESKIDFGPGYRLYFGKDGDTLVILLCGGTKKRQQNDIKKAQQLWADYKRRKKKGET